MNIDESEVSVLAREVLRLQSKIASQADYSRAMWISGYMYGRDEPYHEAEQARSKSGENMTTKDGTDDVHSEGSTTRTPD